METNLFLIKGIRAAIFSATMFMGLTSAFAQVKVGTNPTTIDANSNIEVEPSTAGRNFRIHKTSGQVTIKDGTEGTGKILTSDANGNASWQAPSSQSSPVVFAVNTGAGQPLPLSTYVKVNFDNKAFDKNNVFDLAANQFVVPAIGAGYYDVKARITTANTTHTINCYLYVFVNGSLSTQLAVGNAGAGAGVIVTGSILLQLNAGDVVDLRCWTDTPDVVVTSRNLYATMLTQ